MEMTPPRTYRRIGHDGAAQARLPYFDWRTPACQWGGVHRLQLPDCHPFELGSQIVAQVCRAVTDFHARTWADLHNEGDPAATNH